MQAFPMAHAAEVDAETTLAACLRNFKPNAANGIGLVFASAEFGQLRPGLIERLREATGIARWMGASGFGICASSTEYYDRPALALMQLDLPPGSLVVLDGPAPALAERTVSSLAGGLGLVFLDARQADGMDWLRDVQAAVPDSFLIGGLGDSGEVTGTSGHDAVLIAPECEVLVDHTQGCSLIGEAHTITRTFRNIVVELDGRPALQVLEEEIGEVLARDLQRALGYIFTALPVRGLDHADYQVRNIIGVDRQHQLIAIGDVPEEGGRLQFARRDGNSARDDMEQMLVRLRRRAGRKTPRGAVYISCIGRGRNQFGPGSAELKMISDALGDIPLVGFYAGGEVYQARTYAYTGVLALFL